MELNGAELISFYDVRKNLESNKNNYAEFVTIPHYQRPYKWGQEQIDNLIDDFFDNIEHKPYNQDTKYFTGSIVSALYYDKYLETNKQILIDGQQRYTTIFLINFLKLLALFNLLDRQLHNDQIFSSNETVNNIKKALQEFITDYNNFAEKIGQNIRQLERINDKPENERKNKKNEIRYSINELTTIDSILNKQNHSLILEYDRTSFNESLKEALSNIKLKVQCSGLEIEIKRDSNLDSTTNKYLNAINHAFQNLNEKVKSSLIEQNILEDEWLNQFIEKIDILFGTEKQGGLQFCLIQTHSQEDAYTLFEVLNDRSLALSDMEIIKNKLYKTYYVNSSDDKEKEKIIDNLDNQWDKIFNDEKLHEYRRSQCIDLSVRLITQKNNFKSGNNRVLLEPVDKYLKKNKRTYGQNDIKQDFNKIEFTKHILNICDAQRNKAARNLCELACKSDNDEFQKYMQLALFEGRNGVAVAGPSYLLISHFANLSSKPNNFKDDIYYYITNDDKLRNLSILMWWSTLSETMVKHSKTLSDSLIHRNKDDNKPSLSEFKRLYMEKEKEILDSLESFLSEWKYNKTAKSDTKIKLLFIKLFKYNIDDYYNVKDDQYDTTTGNRLKPGYELEHLEPQTPSPGSNNYYNNPDKQDYIQGLGNILPLNPSTNKDVSNWPIQNKINLIYNSYSTDDNRLRKTFLDIYNNYKDQSGIPTKEFFEQRKKVLIKVFQNIAKYEINIALANLP